LSASSKSRLHRHRRVLTEGAVEQNPLTGHRHQFEKFRSKQIACRTCSAARSPKTSNNTDILVFVAPRLKMKEMRGTALAETTLPVILVNGKDRSNGRVFTLLHEFCHLALRQSGVSNVGGDRNDAPSPPSSRCPRTPQQNPASSVPGGPGRLRPETPPIASAARLKGPGFRQGPGSLALQKLRLPSLARGR
jgi:hypothetical protein